ncbi:serine protease trypsin-like protein [Phytophthora sojae]|uniref:Glucanase inhibitor protein 3 n=2 Tax=Phytophthora sojae TaxID=67593 RepID=GIP3_PHYSP|nr:serine protease trypsin-like protein [Phytophthora sojae]G5AE35.1 RecName: Full=Glucanase inhibitor protein 3; Flags: Precursor [Phytophthora sojae strain P6497]EGZ06437.1 serine protease trypsin-like protein [Phytophthora sojae]|eukprot:XP_009538334.1 serine protease trypsin-like protein [Phytophthora sojae]
MKVLSSLAAALIALSAVDVEAEHVQRSLILGGGKVPVGSKTYTVGLRTTPEGDTFCGGALISPTHVLTTASCTAYEEGSSIPHWVAVGTHYLNGKKDGEQLKIVSAQNHTLYDASSFSYNLAVLTLEKPSKFAPIKLPKADGSDIFPRVWSKVMGWGVTSYPNGKPSNELQSVDVRVWGDNACENKLGVDKSSLCAGGEAGKDSCVGDTGDPLIKENGRGDADDILLGLSGWGTGCGDKDMPSVYSRVSAGIEWINSVIKK